MFETKAEQHSQSFHDSGNLGNLRLLISIMNTVILITNLSPQFNRSCKTASGLEAPNVGRMPLAYASR